MTEANTTLVGRLSGGTTKDIVVLEGTTPRQLFAAIGCEDYSKGKIMVDGVVTDVDAKLSAGVSSVLSEVILKGNA